MKTISLETAKKLKEAGWSKRSARYYHIHKDGRCHTTYFQSMGDSNYIENIPAPTLDELLEEMPVEINGYYLTLVKFKDVYSCYYEMFKKYISDKNPAEAVALLWLKLKSEGLI